MHAGAVGIIAAAQQPIRLRSSDTEWLGEKGGSSGSSAAAAALPVWLLGMRIRRISFVRVGLPVVLVWAWIICCGIDCGTSRVALLSRTERSLYN